MFGKESPITILEWNEKTFGNTVDKIANRALLEVAEFYFAVLNDDAKAIVDELADIAIMVWPVAVANNVEVTLKPSDIRYNCADDEDRTQLTKLYARLICMEYINYLYYNSNGMDMRGGTLKLTNVLKYLNTIAYIWNTHLPDIVDNKMAINRSRTWKKVGKDNFQHI